MSQWKIILSVLLITLSATSRAEPQVELDLSSLQCLGCHDNKDPYQSRGNSHPVGQQYPLEQEDYISRLLLPAYVPLPEGRVGCVSCHIELPMTHSNMPLITRYQGIAFTEQRLNTTSCTTCHWL